MTGAVQDFLRKSRTPTSLMFLIISGNSNHVFCVFEGPDDKGYYYERIRSHMHLYKTRYEDIYSLQAEGKDGVIWLYNQINKNRSSKWQFKGKKILYFVDKDFDEPLGINEIYETPCYSIENFYTSQSSFKEIVKNAFHCDNYKKYIQCFKDRQTEFHSKVVLLNQRCWYIRKVLGNKNISFANIEIKKLLNIQLNSIEARKDLGAYLKNIYRAGYDLNELKKIKFNEPQKEFRGKFEIDFMSIYLKKVSDEIETNSDNSYRIKLDPLNSANFLNNFSKFADTPSCLMNYLNDHL